MQKMGMRSMILVQHSLRRCINASVVSWTTTSYSRSTTHTQFNYNPLFNNSFSSDSFSTSPNKKMGVLSWYLGLLESRPIVTKSVTASLIYAAADVTSQMITMPPSGSLDTMRTLRMAGFGLLIVGPAQHTWFNLVGRILPKRNTITTLKKLTMGQVFYAPCLNGIFFSFNAALQAIGE